jgi:hypothetical protein
MVKCKATQKPHVGDTPNDCQTDGFFSLSIVAYADTALSVRSALMQAVNVIVEQQAWKCVSFTPLKCCLISALVAQLPRLVSRVWVYGGLYESSCSNHIAYSKCKHYYQQMPLCDNIFVDGCCVSLHLILFSPLVCCLQTRRALYEAEY